MVSASIKKIIDLLDADGVLAFKTFLCGLKCVRNEDVQRFLHSNAVDFNLRNLTRTFLCVEGEEIAGFFTLAIKNLKINDNTPKALLRKMSSGNVGIDHIPAYLIAQLAKFDGYTRKAGADMVKLAKEVIIKAQDSVGGRVIYVECKDDKRLVTFYEEQGFKFLQKNEENNLNQMIMVLPKSKKA